MMGRYVTRVMARGSAMSILIVLLLLSTFGSTVSGTSGSMVTAGSGGIAVIGLPGHVGDTVYFSSLVHNDGDVSGTASLRLNYSNQTFIGDEITIEPGSSREVTTPFVLSDAGLIDVVWEVISNDSMVSENLSGIFQINVEQPQQLQIEISDYTWSSDDGLDISFRTNLQEGRSRGVSIEVIGISGLNSQTLQRFDSILTPGIRQFSLSLGAPSISSISIQAVPIDWISSGLAIDEITVSQPVISGDIEIISLSPEIPSAGEIVSIEVRISNTGTDRIDSGSVRIISSATGVVLADLTSPSIQSGSESVQTFSVESWPVGNPVDIRAEWYTNTLISESDRSVISNNVVSSSGAEIPWITIGIGGVIGALLGVAMRSAAKGTNKSISMKKSTKSSVVKEVNDESSEKREVNCPECDRALLIPYSYSGRARCAPPCSTEFSVNPETEEKNDNYEIDDVEVGDDESRIQDSIPEPLVSMSKDDLLDCPSCGQMLKVPISKRPATARCPACRSEFEALEG